MVVFLLKFILFVIITLSSLITRLIFSVTAYTLMLFIYAFKVPGEAIQGALQQFAEAVKACVEFLVELIIEAIGSLISSAVDFVKDAVIESIASTGPAIGGLLDKAKVSLEGLLESIPQIFEGISEMISTIVSDLWKNYVDAVQYVKENA